MSRTRAVLCVLAALAGMASPVASIAAAAGVELDSAAFGSLTVRAIGPAVMSGRISALTAVAEDPLTLYAGAAGGGLWVSKDGGIAWSPLFDEHNASIGAVTVDPKDPKTLWVGTGESWVRNSVSVGDGVYKSIDGGESWERKGLAASERIARIRVSPEDSKTVWVCATGPLWSDGEERGVFKSTDGGATWKRTLFANAGTGCSDLDLDPQDPRVLYAGMWQFRRTPWSFYSGGAGSGLFKSTDGGETWRPITRGLPAGEKGRIAVAVAPSRPSVVYALVEAGKTAFYRSEDLGESFTEVNSSSGISGRPFYFARIVVDPVDWNRVYKPGLGFTYSLDGGKTFNGLGLSTSVHSDHHDLWIDPRNPRQLVLGTDGGVYLSHDQGQHWRLIEDLPVSQFYRVSYDMDFPYNVYGGLQDNGSWMGPSRGTSGIGGNLWRNIDGGDGFYAFRDPTDPDLAYVEYQGGRLGRFRLSTGERKNIQPAAGKGDPALRFNWNTPVHLSRSRPGTLYVGAQSLYRSRDRGDSWEKISPDLSTNDNKKQQQATSGGLTVDNSSAENHTTIFAICESPKNPDVLWVGTDDGNLQLSRDGGKSWSNVVEAVPGLPAHTWVSGVEASRHDEATAYAVFDGHMTGDGKTYVYKTADFGRSWQPLATAELAGYAHVVREDPVNPALLFLGTESGLFMSFDGGGRWVRFSAGLPRVAVRDLAIHPRDGDLIIATHGRGIYILDDITPLRHLTAELLERDAALLPSRPAPMILPSSIQGFPGDHEFVGDNPPEAAVIHYYLKKRHVVGDLKLEVHDREGKLVTTLPSGKRRGINRVLWPMRLPPPKVPPADTLVASAFSFQGPRVPEGVYEIRLVRGGETLAGKVELVIDPRSRHSAEDRALQQQTAMVLYEDLADLTYVVDAILALRGRTQKQAGELKKGSAPGKALDELDRALTALLKTLVSTSGGGLLSGEEQLREKLVDLYGAVNGYLGRPSRPQLDSGQILAEELAAAEKRLAAIEGAELARANRWLAGAKKPPLRALSREEWQKQAPSPSTSP